jgi:endonuclease/exonuclease/phosphatase family metal-dependent hydrolase
VNAPEAASSGDTGQPPTALTPPSTATDTTKIPDSQTQFQDENSDLDAADYLSHDTAIAVLRAPWAKDAARAAVPVSLTANPDNTVTMTVGHHGAAYSYPVVADPHLKGRVRLRTETWNLNRPMSSIDAVGSHLAAQGARFIGLQEVCKSDMPTLRDKLGGASKWWMFHADLYKLKPKDPCMHGSGVFISKAYPVKSVKDFDARVPANGSGGAHPCHPARPSPRCIQKVSIHMAPRGGDPVFFNAHLGRHGSAPYDWVANYALGAPGIVKAVMGDFNVNELASERSLLKSFLNDSRWLEVDRRNRPTFMDRKYDYIFFGSRPGDWRFSAVLGGGTASDHQAIVARLDVPYYG